MSIASRVSRRYALCPAKPKHSLVVISLFAMWCKIPFLFPGVCHGFQSSWSPATDPVRRRV